MIKHIQTLALATSLFINVQAYAQTTSTLKNRSPEDCIFCGKVIASKDLATHRQINELSVIGKGQNENLSAGYYPDDLVDIDPAFMTPQYRNDIIKLQEFEKVRKDTYYFLKKMITDAHTENIDLFIHSGFRPFQMQCQVFKRKLKKDMDENKTSIEQAILNVNTRSALPGTSEHQLGTSVDLVTFLEKYEKPEKKYSGYAVEYEMQNTEAFKWLNANAHKYGFALSYPYSKTLKYNEANPRTGYIYEPWHWRYIHPTYAAKFKQCEGMVLKEFLIELAKNPKFECNKSVVVKKDVVPDTIRTQTKKTVPATTNTKSAPKKSEQNKRSFIRK